MIGDVRVGVCDCTKDLRDMLAFPGYHHDATKNRNGGRFRLNTVTLDMTNSKDQEADEFSSVRVSYQGQDRGGHTAEDE